MNIEELLELNDFQSLKSEIAKLDSIEMHHSWTQAQWNQIELNWKQYKIFVSSHHGNINAFALFLVSDIDAAHLLKIAVLSSHRTRGIGSSMIKICKDYFAKQNYSSLYLEVAENNESAIEFYLKNDFKKLILKKNFYSDGLAAYAMQAKLN